MKNCYICGKECLDYDTVTDGIYLNINGKFDTISMCKNCYNDLDKARMQNDVEFLMHKRGKKKTVFSHSKLYNMCEFKVGDNVYFIVNSPVSAAHPFVFNKQIQKGMIIAIKIEITKDCTNYKYFIKHESDKCCKTYSNIFKTKEEAEKEL